ncbi:MULTISPECIES: ABC transporter permease [Enterococcus]|jgi:NitT/TauT family transport system permease protein|uniref:ABC transporter permease n=1 Tax=Enterococcus entomosocium TaxID=3034352 RepID=A0ABV3MA80_9ENTE|nr:MULTISPECIES: ABC transporter permease [Enterococcus]AMG51307.1 ABC transporter permease [Enterococcus gallinarum]EPH59793.1 ABC transporter, permease protein [Enterococcus faecium 13.SD.W.09]OTO95673.1 hypothetical protein A5852_001591 [Enterococcus faecium]EJF50371.1 binding-protein-dependent transport system inner membrane component [Enterococcus sp. C1]MDB1708067.1 ABC transporter permease [Enterococcus casseliflavus]
MKPIKSFAWGFCSFVVVWWGVSWVTNNRSLPNPLETAERFWALREVLLIHTGASLLRVFAALSGALLVGVPLGILIGRSQRVDRLLGPLLYFLYPIPKVAFLPVFMIFFGLGNLSKILLIFAVIVIQVIVSIRDAVTKIPPAYFQVMKNYTNQWHHVLRFVILPALMPALFASVRVSIGIALASLFFAENYNTTYGVGYLILSAWSKMDYPQMLSGILLIALMGYLLFASIDWLEKVVCRYRQS